MKDNCPQCESLRTQLLEREKEIEELELELKTEKQNLLDKYISADNRAELLQDENNGLRKEIARFKNPLDEK